MGVRRHWKELLPHSERAVRWGWDMAVCWVVARVMGREEMSIGCCVACASGVHHLRKFVGPCVVLFLTIQYTLAYQLSPTSLLILDHMVLEGAQLTSHLQLDPIPTSSVWKLHFL